MISGVPTLSFRAPSASVTVSIPPLGDVKLPAGLPWGDIKADVAALLCWPDLVTTRFTAGRVAITDQTMIGSPPLEPGAILRPMPTPAALAERRFQFRLSGLQGIAAGVRRLPRLPTLRSQFRTPPSAKPHLVGGGKFRHSAQQRALRRWVAPALPSDPNRTIKGSRRANLAGPVISGLGSIAVAYAMRQPIFALFGLFALLALLPGALPNRMQRLRKPGTRRDLRQLRLALAGAGSLTDYAWQELVTPAQEALPALAKPELVAERALAQVREMVNSAQAVSPNRAVRLATALAARGLPVELLAAVSGQPVKADWLRWFSPDGKLPGGSAVARGVESDPIVGPTIRIQLAPGQPARRLTQQTERLAREWSKLQWERRPLAWTAIGTSPSETLPDLVPLRTLLDTNMGSKPGTNLGTKPGINLGTKFRTDLVAASSAPKPSKAEPTPPTSAAHWRVPLGIGSQGMIDFDLIKDGPHLLVAGTTGSGKSEVLRSLVLALAASHSPSELSLVLVDFKGGTSFGNCRDLPHVVGQVTDLEPGLASRVIVGLRAELRRRKHLLAEATVADISQLPLGSLPRLVVVFDEFRALTEEIPDAVEQLLRIAAQGRSLGVHLVLATQRASGAISAEVRANISARLALRLVDAADSADVIESPTAAHLPALPGRAVLKLGSSPEVVFQSAWADAPQFPQVARPDWYQTGEAAIVPSSELPAPTPPSSDLITKIATRYRHVRPGKPPWLPPLPTSFDLTELATTEPLGVAVGQVRSRRQLRQAKSGSYAEAPIGGLLRFALGDYPEEQAQRPIAWRPSSGALGILGGARTGRSTTLLTLAAAALQAGFQVHFLGKLPAAVPAAVAAPALENHPLMGTIVPISDLNRAARLLRLLGQNVSTPAPKLPHLVLIDQLEQWRAAFLDAGVDMLDLLADLPEHCGVAVTASAANCGGLAAKLSAKLVLLSGDRNDDLLLGAPPTKAGLGTCAGRGVWLSGAEQALVQVALPRLSVPDGGLTTTFDRSDEPTTASASTVTASARASSQLDGNTPADLIRLRPLPKALPARLLPAGSIGSGGNAAEPLELDLSDGALVTGPRGSGRTAALGALLRAWIHSQSDFDLAGFDPAGQQANISKLRGNAAQPNAVVIGFDQKLQTAATALGCPFYPASQQALAAVAAQPPALLVLDDLDNLANLYGGAALDRLGDLAQAGELTVLAATTTFNALVSNRGIVGKLRAARTGIVLRPAERGSGEVFAAQLPPPHDLPIPGRGWLVQSGRVEVIQICAVDLVDWELSA